MSMMLLFEKDSSRAFCRQGSDQLNWVNNPQTINFIYTHNNQLHQIF